MVIVHWRTEQKDSEYVVSDYSAAFDLYYAFLNMGWEGDFTVMSSTGMFYDIAKGSTPHPVNESHYTHLRKPKIEYHLTRDITGEVTIQYVFPTEEMAGTCVCPRGFRVVHFKYQGPIRALWIDKKENVKLLLDYFYPGWEVL